MGLRTDPCGTPIGEDVIGDLEFPMEANWRRFDKYELNQERAMPVIPKEVLSLFMRIGWSIVSKAALISRETRTVDKPWSMKWRMRSRFNNRAVSVEWYRRYASLV